MCGRDRWWNVKDVATATTPISSAKTQACFLLNVVCQCVGAWHWTVPTCILRLRMVVLPSPKCLTFGVAFHKKHGKSFLGAEFCGNKFREPRAVICAWCDVEVRFCHPGSCKNPRFTAVTSLGLPFQDLELEGREGGEIGGPFVCKQISTTIFLYLFNSPTCWLILVGEQFLFENCKVSVYILLQTFIHLTNLFWCKHPGFSPKQWVLENRGIAKMKTLNG